MTTSLAALVQEGKVVREMPMPTFMYGVIALVLFTLGMAFVWSFRGTAQKVRDRDPGQHGPGHH